MDILVRQNLTLTDLTDTKDFQIQILSTFTPTLAGLVIEKS